MAFLRWLWLNSPNVARTAGGRSLQISSKSIGSTIGSVFHFLITWLLLTKPYRHPLIWSRLLSQPRWDYQKCHFKHFRFERLFRGLRIFGPMYFWLLSSTNSSSREQHCTWRYLNRKSSFVQRCGSAGHLAYDFENENHIPGEYCCGFSSSFSHVVTTIFARANFSGIRKSMLVSCFPFEVDSKCVSD